MSKKFQLVHPNMDRAFVGPSNTNQELCAICQEDTAESIACPATSKRLGIWYSWENWAYYPEHCSLIELMKERTSRLH